MKSFLKSLKKLGIFILLNTIVGGITIWFAIETNTFLLALIIAPVLYSWAVIHYYVRKNESIWLFPFSHFSCFVVLSTLFFFLPQDQGPRGYVDFSEVFSLTGQLLLLPFWLIPSIIAAVVNDSKISKSEEKEAEFPESGNCEAESAPDEAPPPEGGQPGPDADAGGNGGN